MTERFFFFFHKLNASWCVKCVQMIEKRNIENVHFKDSEKKKVVPPPITYYD